MIDKNTDKKTNKKTNKKRIVSFDLDMTLLDQATWKIPDSAIEAVEMLRKDSIIVIASGRNMDGPLSVGYKEQIRPDAVIHMNGTRVVAGDELLYEHFMDKDLLKRLLSYGEEKGIAMGLTIGDKDYFINPAEVERIDKIRWKESMRNFQDPWEMLELPIRTLAYIGEAEPVADLEEHFPELKFPLFSSRLGADIVEVQASKANGLVRLCEYYGMDISQTIAFGDSMNDYEIVRAAGTGIAMGNSVKQLKDAADYVTDDVDQDGIWNACRHFGWI